MKKRLLDKSIIFLVLIGLVLIGFVIFCAITFRSNVVSDKINKKESFSILTTVSKDNELVFANVFFYNPSTHKGCFLDIPVTLGGLVSSQNKIIKYSSLYQYKKNEKYINELNIALDTNIDFYMDYKLSNYCDIVDLLGGINVFVIDPKNLDIDGKVYSIPAGNFSIDGFKSFINLQDTESQDYIRDRLKFSSQFYGALGSQSSIFSSNRVYGIFAKRVNTNLDKAAYKSLMKELNNFKSEEVDFKEIFGQTRDVGDGVNVLFPNSNGTILKNLVKSVLTAISNEDTEHSDLLSINIEILNGTEKNGLGKQTANIFKSYGYKIVNIKNAESSNVSKTLIIDRNGNSDILKGMSEIINCSNYKIEKANTENQNDALFAHYTIILGKDFNGKQCN